VVAHIDGRSIEISGHQRKRLLARAEVQVIVGRRNIARAEVVVLRARLRVDQPDAHQLLGMRKRKTA
jgi:hypothetical protein